MSETVTLESVLEAGNLLPIDQVLDEIYKSEPVVSVPMNTSQSDVKFILGEEWGRDIELRKDDELIDAYLQSSDNERYQLTKEACLMAATNVGLPAAYVKKTPGEMISPHLNYWYNHVDLQDKFKALAVGGEHVQAFTKATLDLFSNQRLVDTVLAEVGKTYGTEDPIYVDSKYHHNLKQTYLRLVIPAGTREIVNTSVNEDNWSVGVQLKNSLTGEGPTALDGYLFRWWCSNGAIDSKHSLGSWDRRLRIDSGDHQQAVLDWAQESSQRILERIPDALASVQGLTETSIEGQSSDVLRDLFNRYGVPARMQNPVLDHALDNDPTMYEVMQAFTQAANGVTNPKNQEELMLVGGDIALSEAHRCDSCHRVVD